ncbi:hypothetical protein VNI00_016971 [Paramarasmius palmivorus]|uniref:F-box domain-containing protein n=1 Tax=Paramarasmius palmivorus TaxID=297713 RepID=A0AAW0B998_9AGAR
MPEAQVQTYIHPVDPFHDMYDTDYASFSTGSRLGRVCRHWRDVTLCTPALWASIFIEITNSPYSSKTPERLKLYLQRSKASALSIALQVGALTLTSIHFELILLVLQNAHRITRLALHLTKGGVKITDLFQRHFSRPFTALTTLIVKADYNEDPCKVVEALNKQSSSLRHIGISSFGRFGYKPLPIPQLTGLTINTISIDMLSLILSTSTHLQSLNASIQFFGNPLATIPVLEDLRSLDIKLLYGPFPFGCKEFTFNGYRKLVNLLSAPNLNRLSVKMSVEVEQYPEWRASSVMDTFRDFASEFKSFIARCPVIQSFSLVSAYFEDSQLLSILGKMPNLLALDVVDAVKGQMAVTNRLMEALGTREVLPKLKDLRLDLPEFNLRQGAFEEMLWSRRKHMHAHGDRLRSAYLKVDDVAMPDLDPDDLRELQREGLAVRVVYVRPSTKYWRQDEEVELVGYRVTPSGKGFC